LLSKVQPKIIVAGEWQDTVDSIQAKSKWHEVEQADTSYFSTVEKFPEQIPRLRSAVSTVPLRADIGRAETCFRQSRCRLEEVFGLTGSIDAFQRLNSEDDWITSRHIA
jgi:hypothetical protein